MGYILDFRKKALEIRKKENLSIAETARRFGVGRSSIICWINNIKPCTTRNKPATKINMEALKKDVADNPDLYLERAEKFNISGSGIFYALRRLNIRCKRKLKASESRPIQKSYFQNNSRKVHIR